MEKTNSASKKEAHVCEIVEWAVMADSFQQYTVFSIYSEILFEVLWILLTGNKLSMLTRLSAIARLNLSYLAMSDNILPRSASIYNFVFIDCEIRQFLKRLIMMII